MKTKHYFSLYSVATAILLSLSSGLADDKRSILNAADEKFIKQAASSGLSELKIAELGAKKAERADIKEHAELLVKDYTRINVEIKTLASSKGGEFSDVPLDLKHSATFQKLEKKDGKAFDKAFLDDIEDAGKKVVSDFEEASRNAKDDQLKTFVENTLPTLRIHLDKITELKAK